MCIRDSFFTAKGIVEQLLEQLSVTGYDVEADKDEYSYHPGRCAKFTLDGDVLGIVGEIHPQVAEQYGTVSYTHLNFGCCQIIMKAAFVKYNPDLFPYPRT